MSDLEKIKAIRAALLSVYAPDENGNLTNMIADPDDFGGEHPAYVVLDRIWEVVRNV